MTRTVRLLLIACAIVALCGCAGRGREVFVREGCGDCHRCRDLGGGGAPDLTEVGSRRDAAWVRMQVGNPAAHNPATRMPAFARITGIDLWSLVAFLRG